MFKKTTKQFRYGKSGQITSEVTTTELSFRRSRKKRGVKAGKNKQHRKGGELPVIIAEAAWGFLFHHSGIELVMTLLKLYLQPMLFLLTGISPTVVPFIVYVFVAVCIALFSKTVCKMLAKMWKFIKQNMRK